METKKLRVLASSNKQFIAKKIDLSEATKEEINGRIFYKNIFLQKYRYNLTIEKDPDSSGKYNGTVKRCGGLKPNSPGTSVTVIYCK